MSDANRCDTVFPSPNRDMERRECVCSEESSLSPITDSAQVRANDCDRRETRAASVIEMVRCEAPDSAEFAQSARDGRVVRKTGALIATRRVRKGLAAIA